MAGQVRHVQIQSRRSRRRMLKLLWNCHGNTDSLIGAIDVNCRARALS